VTTIYKRAGLVLKVMVVCLFSLPVHPEALAQDEPVPQPPLPVLEFQPTYSSSFDTLWMRYVDAVQRSDTEGAERFLQEIQRLRVERGVFSLHDIALAFAYRAKAHLERGEFEEAENNFRIARELDPTLPTAHLGLSRVAAQSGALGFVSSFGHVVRAFLASVSSPRNRGHAFFGLVTLYLILSSIVFGLFALMMLYRYGGLLRHDLKERFSDRLGRVGVVATLVGLLLFPLLLTFGLGWLVPYWLVLTFAYQSVRERAITIVALAVLFLVAPFAEIHANWSRTIRNPLYRSSFSSLEGTFEPGDPDVLRRALLENPDDHDLKMLVATQYKNLGEYELSASRYREILEQDPDDLTARVNLGNIYFAQRDWEGARIEYDRAIENHSNSAVAFYNKSLAHAESFKFREREEARARAESLDSALVRSHERRVGEYRAVIDLKLGPKDIYAKYYGLEEGLHPTAVNPSFIGGFFGLGSRFALAVVVLVGLIFLFKTILNRANTRHCWKCKTAFCGRCQIGTGRRGLCTQCYHLFYVKDGVSAVARNEKMNQVQRAVQNRGLIFRVLSIITPGAGHIAEDMPLLGLMFLIVWMSGAVFLLLGGRLFGIPDELLGVGSSWGQIVAGVVMAIALVLSNTVAQPRPRK
jgi:tetratricopeptide (TPR) repeat protein